MTLIPFTLPRHSPEPTVEVRLDKLTTTVETYGQALAHIERTLLAILDDTTALRARLDAFQGRMDAEDAR